MLEIQKELIEFLKENGYRPRNTKEYAVYLKKKLKEQKLEILYNKEENKFYFKNLIK